MIEIYPNLFIGAQEDYEFQVRGQPDWKVVHACKEPYHRIELGYTSRGAPKNHPEYLIARRGNRLVLNLVDADNPNFVPKEIIDSALDFIKSGLGESLKVLVHCNRGESRSPSIGMLYLAIYTDKLPKEFISAEQNFRQDYPLYNPSFGMRGFLAKNWSSYVSEEGDKGVKNETIQSS